MAKIEMTAPVVEIDGDEMTRIIWAMIKEKLLAPFISLRTEYYDLGLVNRDKTDDKVTADAADAIKKYGVGIKCATITPNAQRMDEYKLKKMYLSPNATIRAALDGTIFRAPILAKGISPLIPAWTKPITIARHAYGDIYKNVESRVEAGSRAELVITDKDGNVSVKLIHAFDGDGITQGIHNTDKSITSFARACFEYALATNQDIWFGTKDTISKTYDHRFKDIFADVYCEYKDRLINAGLAYDYNLIDDSVARTMRSCGGYIWALKNYDGDVMSDMMATVYGSLAMMSSVLVSPDGNYEYEAAHGTVTRHYYRYLNGESTSTNPVATIFAWSGGLRRRGIMDNNADLAGFADRLEGATLGIIENGIMTKDLTGLYNREGYTAKGVDTAEFLDAVAARLYIR